MQRYPYFAVRYLEENGDFYAVPNDLPFPVTHTPDLPPLGGTENRYYLIGVTHDGCSVNVSFHHALADGRGVGRFVETLLWYYCKAAYGSTAPAQGILTEAVPVSERETADPCSTRYPVDRSKLGRIEGLSRKGFTLPETKGEKASHRRYELRFPQEAFMQLCRRSGASPVVMLSVMMSRAIRSLHPEAGCINSNFPVDARAALGMDGTCQNCVKSISLPYGEAEEALSEQELCSRYKALMNAQREPERCKDEFNKIVMLLDAVSHLHSFRKKRMVMRFLDDLKLDTYLISYVGQFRFGENAQYIDSVHLFSDCSDGLVLNMTCQCGMFCIDMVQDGEGAQYVSALLEQFRAADVPVESTQAIAFTTPCDHLMRDQPVMPEVLHGQRSLWERTVDANVRAYRAVRNGAVAGYASVESAFVRTFLARPGETVGEARLRLAGEQLERDLHRRDALARMYRHSA